MIIKGKETGDYIGNSDIDMNSDFNADGYNDILIGAKNAGVGGEVYLFYGSNNLSSSLTVDEADVTFVADVSSQFGISLTSGDIDNDGYPEAIVATYNYTSDDNQSVFFFSPQVQEFKSVVASNLQAGKSLEIGSLVLSDDYLDVRGGLFGIKTSNWTIRQDGIASFQDLNVADNLGIGTSSPLQTLTIKGTSGTDLLNIASSTGDSLFYINESGQVGIGTTSPSAKFAVDGLMYIGGTGTSTITDNLHVGGALKVGDNSLFIDEDSISASAGLTINPGNSQTVIIGGDGLEINGNISFSAGVARSLTVSTSENGTPGNLSIKASNGNCFLAGTKISMSDGEYKNIEEVQVGEKVVSYDELSKTKTISKVIDIYHHPIDEMVDDNYLIIKTEKGKLIKVTPNHRIYSDGVWKFAGDLKVNDHLLNDQNEIDKISSIQKVYKKVLNYNLEIEKYHVYYAESILVHNIKPGTPTVPGNLYLTAGNDVITGSNNGGDVYIYGGALGSGGHNGNVILAHNGTSSLGMVGIGTSSPTAQLEIYKSDADSSDVMFEVASSTGIGFKIMGDGEAISDKAFNSGGADYAEYFWTDEDNLEAGEAVCVDVSHENAVKRCDRLADSNVMGIVSSNPSIVGNYKEEYAESDNYIIIAMLGQIPAKISTENGPIRPGDSLTPATEPGYIARALPGNPTVGIALEGLGAEIIESSEASSSEEQYELNTAELKILISRRNKSLTVDMVENKITERIANMEIEDEVAIMLQNAIDEYNLASSTEAIVDEQIAMFDSVLSVEFDNVNNELLTVTANLDSVIARVSALENSFGEIDHRISVLEESGLGENEPDSNKAFVMTEDGSLILSNDDNHIAERLESTSTPSVAIVEIYSGTTTDKTALIINQEGSGDVADFRAGGVSIVNIASEGEVAVVGEMSIDGRLMVCSGAGCGLALDSAVDETMGDMGVEGTVVAGAFAGYCEDGYIWVPGSSKYGTMPGFCVSQDEMRYEYTEELMANMTQGEAMLTCEALGDAYHLISENEWLTIAENVIRVAENDINTEEDGLQLACASSSEIIVASSTNFILSNGNIINNLAGGIAEWTSETITKAGVFEPQTEDWQEYFMIDNYQGYNVAPPYYYSSENNIGRIKTGTASSSPDYLRAFVRGESALFDLDLSHSPVEATSTIGFRCAK